MTTILWLVSAIWGACSVAAFVMFAVSERSFRRSTAAADQPEAAVVIAAPRSPRHALVASHRATA